MQASTIRLFACSPFIPLALAGESSAHNAPQALLNVGCPLFPLCGITLPLRELTQFPGMVSRHYRRLLARAVPREKHHAFATRGAIKTMTNRHQDLMSAKDNIMACMPEHSAQYC